MLSERHANEVQRELDLVRTSAAESLHAAEGRLRGVENQYKELVTEVEALRAELDGRPSIEENR